MHLLLGIYLGLLSTATGLANDDMAYYGFYKRASSSDHCSVYFKGDQPQESVPSAPVLAYYKMNPITKSVFTIQADRAFAQDPFHDYDSLIWVDGQTAVNREQVVLIESVVTADRFKLAKASADLAYLVQDPPGTFPPLEIFLVEGTWESFSSGATVKAKLSIETIPKLNKFFFENTISARLNAVLAQIPLRVPDGPTRPNLSSIVRSSFAGVSEVIFSLNRSEFDLEVKGLHNENAQLFAGLAFVSEGEH